MSVDEDIVKGALAGERSFAEQTRKSGDYGKPKPKPKPKPLPSPNPNKPAKPKPLPSPDSNKPAKPKPLPGKPGSDENWVARLTKKITEYLKGKPKVYKGD